MFSLVACPRLDHTETALELIKRLGFKPAYVRHTILTHLDMDHGGDFFLRRNERKKSSPKRVSGIKLAL